MPSNPSAPLRVSLLQGMLIATSEVITDSKVTISLWKHECTRVIADRFTVQADKDWFEKSLKQVGTALSRSGTACTDVSRSITAHPL